MNAVKKGRRAVKSAPKRAAEAAKDNAKDDAKAKAEDERFIVIDGRRWRRSDPSIPEAFRAELVRELMSARRAVLAAKRSDDASAEKAARARVQDAKVALGERGRPYWEEPDASAQRKRAEAVARALLANRAPDKTICPSDIARVIGADQWRAVMPQVRDLANAWAENGNFEVHQKGRKVSNPRTAKGPIRIARARAARR